ncbi:MAG: hypothetical protein FWD86_01840 [Firmicutes bacterium]|nr:hypothetical protein [Bacillota bacterium]
MLNEIENENENENKNNNDENKNNKNNQSNQNDNTAFDHINNVLLSQNPDMTNTLKRPTKQLQKSKNPKTQTSNQSGQPKKNIHEGHRARVRNAVNNDPELDSFSDFETLEYLLSFLIPRKDTNSIAHQLIDEFDSLYGVLTALPEELFKIANMTNSAAHFIPNLLAIARKAEISRRGRSVIVETVQQALDVLRPYFMVRNHEKLYMVLIDVNDMIMSINCVSSGTGDITYTNINTIVSRVSRTQACKIILAHNHPGGNLTPSKADIETTTAISFVLRSLGKVLVDHLIFAGDKYFSFYESGLIEKILKSEDTVFSGELSKEVQSRLFVNKYMLEKDAKGTSGTSDTRYSQSMFKQTRKQEK